METRCLRGLHDGLRYVKHQVGSVRGRQANTASGRSRGGNKKTRQNSEQERGPKLQYRHGVFRFTFTHHPVPVRSLLNGRLGPYDDVGRKIGRSSKLCLGASFQTGPAARQIAKSALHCQTTMVRVQASRNGWDGVKLTLFLYMWGDTALRGRVNGEHACIRAALHVSVHSASTSIDGSLEGFGFPTVQESGIKAVPGSVAVG